MIRVLFATFFLLVAFNAQAKRPSVAIDLSKDHVHITSAFSGEHLVLFGVQNKTGDLIITIEGPEKDMVVRRKERTAGIWMNRKSEKFNEIPSYYNYAVANDIDLDDIRGQGVGIDAGESKFKKALIRNKQTQNLFASAPEPIKFIDEGFFRTKFYIPSNVSTGTFTIKTHLMNNGKIETVSTKEIAVKQIGSADTVLRFSKDNALWYGILCVIFAMGIGWLSNYIRGRLR